MSEHAHSGPGYASPAEAIKAPPEELVYVAALHTGTGVEQPDFLATVGVDPDSATYGQIVHRTAMPYVGDELHHYGWRVCSSACHTSNLERRYLVVPGFRSSRIHVVDVGDPRAPELAKVIEPEEVKAKTGLSAPHTVHCMPGNQVVLAMLGDADGGDGAGFAVLDAETFELKGRWENGSRAPVWNYDFWYQPRKGYMISSEWAAPNTFRDGFDLEDVAAGRYGHSIHVWDLERRQVVQDLDLGPDGMIPLEIRWLHDPDADQGFVGAALSSTMWRVHRNGAGGFAADKVVEVEPRDLEGFPVPVPGLITDLVVSMDDRYLYFSNWLHGDLRQYDISDPAQPVLKSSVRLGGLFEPAVHPNGRRLTGGPQMLQLSMDGERLYVTNSLYSTWDNQFYPELESWLLKLDAGDGGLRLDPGFFVDFAPARAHEIHLPGGDPTTEIFG